MKKLTVLIAALCLLLSGCGNWMDGSYLSVTPHQEERPGSDQSEQSVASYLELRDALCDLVENGLESATILVGAFDPTLLENSMYMASRYITKSHPIGAYAVEEIQYEKGTSGGVPALAVTISYNHNRSTIRRIKQVEGMEQVEEQIFRALDRCEAGVVLLVDGYEKEDFPQLVETYARHNPNLVMELPAVAAASYPESGVRRVLEVVFTYQTNRDTLRAMQNRVQPVYESADLYVTGDARDGEKYDQLFSFLTQRFEYRLETSITPAYSLLCHGVGDSKAFAENYGAICRQAGLECWVVTGTRNGEPWSWNIIRNDGIAYHVDPARFCNTGDFRMMSDWEMTGYVWDYSAYPACGEEGEKTDPTEETAPEETLPAEQLPGGPGSDMAETGG